MMNVQISEDLALKMLVEICKAWETSKQNIDLFEKMYEHYIDGGCFDGGEFDVMSIVDNDVVNYCNVISKGDEDFEELLKLYHDDEYNYDISCHTFESGSKYSYIEAISDDETRFLVRCY